MVLPEEDISWAHLVTVLVTVAGKPLQGIVIVVVARLWPGTTGSQNGTVGRTVVEKVAVVGVTVVSPGDGGWHVVHGADAVRGSGSGAMGAVSRFVLDKRIAVDVIFLEVSVPKVLFPDTAGGLDGWLVLLPGNCRPTALVLWIWLDIVEYDSRNGKWELEE